VRWLCVRWCVAWGWDLTGEGSGVALWRAGMGLVGLMCGITLQDRVPS